MAEVTAEQVNGIIERDGLYAFGEKLRALKFKVAALAGDLPQYTDFADDATVIASNRQDAATLKPMSLKSMREMSYAIATLNSALQAIDSNLISTFCVRGPEFNQL